MIGPNKHDIHFSHWRNKISRKTKLTACPGAPPTLRNPESATEYKKQQIAEIVLKHAAQCI